MCSLYYKCDPLYDYTGLSFHARVHVLGFLFPNYARRAFVESLLIELAIVMSYILSTHRHFYYFHVLMYFINEL